MRAGANILRAGLLVLPVALGLPAGCGGGGAPDGPAVGSSSAGDPGAVMEADLAALEAHVRPTADHPATLINFWATW